MAELPALPDVVRAAAEVTDPPPFEAIVRRGRLRRRRQLLASVAVAVVAVLAVVGGVAFAGHDSAAGPVTQTPTPSASPTATPTTTPQRTDPDQIVAYGRLYSSAINDRGDVLTVWQSCIQGGLDCVAAWRLQPVSGATVIARLSGDNPYAQASGDVFVLSGGDKKGVVVDGTGQVRPLRQTRSGDVSPSDVLMRRGEGYDLVDPSRATEWPLPGEVGTPSLGAGLVDSRGTVWVLPIDQEHTRARVTVRWLQSGTWRSHLLTSRIGAVGGAIAATDDHVAALASFEGATVLPVGVLGISVDSGATWTHLTRKDVPFRFVSTFAATSDGTLLILDGTGKLWRSTDATWQHYGQIPGIPRLMTIVPAGARVLGQVNTRDPQLLAIESDGHATAIKAR